MFETGVNTTIDKSGDESVDIDRQLLERICGGDTSAVDVLYRRHAQALLAYLMSIAGSHEAAEEILQDTFVAAWNGASRFQNRSSVRTWLFGIARRQAMNTLRRKSLPTTDDSNLDTFSGHEPEPEQWVIARAERDRIARAVAALSPVHREVLTLTFVHHLSYEEITDVLEIPTGTVKSRLSNARRALRTELARLEEEQ